MANQPERMPDLTKAVEPLNGPADSVEHTIELAAREIEQGNGCATKLLLDSMPSSIEERLKIFRSIEAKHHELFPDSESFFMSGVPYRGSTVNMSIVGLATYESPGLFFGTNSHRSSIDLVKDKWNPQTLERNATCLDSTKSPST